MLFVIELSETNKQTFVGSFVPYSSKLQAIISLLAIEMQNKSYYRLEFTFDSNVMNHFLENIFKLFMIVYILCNQIIGLNSKSSILWKLNDRNGKIYSFSDNDQHVSRKSHPPHTHVCKQSSYADVLFHIYINLWISNKHTFACIVYMCMRTCTLYVLFDPHEL